MPVAQVAVREIFENDGFTLLHTLEQGFVCWANLGEGFKDRLPERNWVAGADEGNVGVVVEQSRFWTPLEGCWKAAAQYQVDGGSQMNGPRLYFTKRSGSPIKVTNPRGHFAVMDRPHILARFHMSRRAHTAVYSPSSIFTESM